MNTRTLLVLAGCAALAWSVRRWRLAVQAGMLLLVFEGAIRKWVFPGAQDLVYFAKDVLFLGAYLGFFRDRQHLPLRYPQAPLLYGGLALGAVLGLLQVFNPRLPSLLVGVLGFKAYFFYVPLLFVVPAAFADDAALARFLKRYVLLAIPVGLLALAQFFSPQSSVLNTYARPTDPGTIATFGSSHYVRATGTFSYVTGFTTYLLTTTVLILIILTTTRWRLRDNFPILLALGMTLLGIMTSGSRAPIFMLALVFPVYWWLGVVREKQGGATFLRLLLGVALLVAGLTSAGDQAVAAFSERASGSSDTFSRVTAPFRAPGEVLPSAGLAGYGIGSTHQIASAVTRGVIPYSWLPVVATEAETGRVMLELGPVGFFLVYLVRIGIALFTLRQVFRLRTVFHRAVAISALLFFLVEIPGGVIFDVTAGVYYWFLAGLVFLVVRLDQAAVPAATPRRAAARVPAGAAVPAAGPLATPARSARSVW